MKKILPQLVAFLKKHKYVFGLVGLQLVVFHNWIFVNRVFTFGDVGVYTKESQQELFMNALSIYNGNFDFGGMNITASSNPFLFAYGVLGKIGIDPIWSEKIMLFYPIVFGVILTSYVFIRYLTKSQLGAFIGSLVYSYNVYFLVTLTGALYLSWAYAFVPLVFLMFLKVLNEPSRMHQLVFVLSSAVLGFIEFRIFYVTAWMLLIYFVSFLNFRKSSMNQVIQYIGRFALPGFLFVFVNIFWIVPLLVAGSLSSNALFDRGLFGDGYFDIINAFAVFHPWWTWAVPSIFVKQVASPFLFIIPIFAVILLIIPSRKQWNDAYAFLLLFLVGVFLTKQSGAPFEAVYLWLYSNIPGFNAFRESSKFFVVSSLALSALVGYYIASMERLAQKAKKWKYMLSLSLVAVFAMVFFNAKTIATGDIETMFIPHDVPQEYVELNKLLLSDKDFSRVLWMPHTNRFGVFMNDHPAISMLMNIDTTYGDFSRSPEKKLEDHLYEPFMHDEFYSLLNKESVRYVIVPSNLVWDEIDSPWKNPENFIDKLDDIPFLKKISSESLEAHNIHVYENEHYRPHIYMTREKELVRSNEAFEEVDFEFENPAEYTVSLKNVSEPVYVNFTEKYHPDWKIRFGDFNWFDVLKGKGRFLSDKEHLKTDADLNSFRIDPVEICRPIDNGACKKNEDGSYDLYFTLYFNPQAHFRFGLIISFVVFLGSFVSIVYYVIKRFKNGNI